MDPIVSPTDPTNIGTANTVREPFGGGKSGVLTRTGVPELDAWLIDWQQKNLGRTIDQGDTDLIQTISRTMHGRPLFPAPAIRQIPEVNIDERPPSELPFDPAVALRHGFEGSTIGALRRWSSLGGPMMMKDDPSYDVFADRAIKDSAFKDQVHLFVDSGSREETAWRLLQFGAREREGRLLERMGGGGVFETAGGMLGDPLNLVPATLGIKAATLAGRTAMLAAPETVALGFKPVIWGGITDAARASAAQAGIALIDAGMHHALDPNATNGNIADIVTLPGAIAAGVGFLVGAHTRFTLGSEALSRAVGNEAFMAGTRARARNLATGEGPAAPGVLSDGERAYWEKAAAANPEGRFHVDGKVMGWEDDNVVFRTAEGLDVRVPARDVDQVSEKSARGIVVSSRRLVSDPALMGSAMKLEGEFLGGGIPRIYRNGDDVTRPGSLHTHYDDMRAAEMGASNTGKAMPEVPVARVKPNEDPRGEWTLEMTDGTKLHAKDLPAGKIVAAEDGGAFQVVNPVGAGEEKSFRRVSHGERENAGSAIIEGDKQLMPLLARDLRPDLHGGGQEAYVLTTDGRIFDVSGIKLSEAELAAGDLSPDAGAHAVFFRRYSELHGQTVTISRFGNSIAADVPQGGRTAQQEAALKRIENNWKRNGGGSVNFGSASLEDVEIAKGGGSLSARAPQGSTVASRRAQLAGNKLVATGIGLERLPFDVINRAAALPFTTWQTTVGDMLSMGGRVHMRNTKGFGFEPNALPVEILIKANWTKPTMDVIRAVRDEWQLYRAGSAPVDPTDLQRIGFEVRTALSDRFAKGPKGLAFEQFRRRVGDALINGDQDLLSDAATPQVNIAAARTRQLLERIKREGADVGVFKEAHEEQLRAAEGKVAGLKKAQAPPDEIAAAELKVKLVQDLLGDVIGGGPVVKTAKSFRPRFWLVDQLRDRADEFKQIVNDWLRSTQPQLSAQARKDIATDIHETLLHDKPVWTKDEVKQNFKDLADPGSAKGRTFQIPDLLVKDFLENDVEAIVRSHARQMGTAIEMHRRFGSTGMEAEAEELQNEAKLLVKAAGTNEARKQVMKQYDLAKADLEATRDRLYGVYGAPDDPHRWSSRIVRMAKQYTNLTTLGMSGVTALGDLIRPVMTEGLQAVHDYGFRTLASDSRSIVLRMSRAELELAGDGMELINNTRALSMSDTGDAYRSRTPFERGLAKANSWFFVMNGLNMVNQLDKEWAGVIIQGNMNKALATLYRGGKIDDMMMQRLAVNGIDDSMARRIGSQFVAGAGGSSRFGKLTIAHTEAWVDDEAAKSYRVALNQMVNRTVPTPTLGDTPNFMSTELGSLMTQYKAFAFGAMNRSLVSGLQEEGRKYWMTAAAAVGFAMILNEIRSRLFYDRSTFDKPMTGVLMDAVDRSSILGYFSDANRAIEVLTGHRAGIRPLIGADTAREESGSRIVGAVAGPAAGQATNALSVLGDFMTLHPTVRTMADARQLIPGQNVPYLDPAFDHLVSDGNRFARKEKKPVNGRTAAAGQ